MNYYNITLIHRYELNRVTFERVQSDTAGYAATKAKALLAEPHEWLILTVTIA
jgi:hypothetical protein